MPGTEFVIVEGGGEVGERGQAGTSIHVYKGNMAKRAVNFFNIEKVARTAIEIVKETVDVLKKFEPFLLRKAHKLCGNIPTETNEVGDEKKMVVSLCIMPRDTQRKDAT